MNWVWAKLIRNLRNHHPSLLTALIKAFQMFFFQFAVAFIHCHFVNRYPLCCFVRDIPFTAASVELLTGETCHIRIFSDTHCTKGAGDASLELPWSFWDTVASLCMAPTLPGATGGAIWKQGLFPPNQCGFSLFFFPLNLLHTRSAGWIQSLLPGG